MLFRSPVVRFFSRILNRITITVVLVALQLLWLCWVAFAITTGTGRVWVNGLLNALSLLVVLYLVRKDENSAYKVGWIALIGILPLLGGALGGVHLSFGWPWLTLPLALPYWLEGGMVALQIVVWKAFGGRRQLFGSAPLHRWLEKRGVDPVNIFYIFGVLALLGLALTLQAARAS